MREPSIPGLRRFFRLPGRSAEQDVDDEIAFHVESRVRDLLAAGETEASARRAAEQEYGDLRASRRELAAVDRHRRRRRSIRHAAESAAQDARYALRSLRRAPAFTITAVLTLVIGLAATTAIFTIVDHVLLRPLPYENPGRLAGAWFDFPPIGMRHAPQSATTYFLYESEARTIDGMAVYSERATNVSDPGSAAPPRRVTTALATWSLFPVLGVSPLRGRAFTKAEDAPGAAPVMMISEGMWRSQLGGDPNVIGRRLDVDGVRREIVGVMPARFRFPTAQTEIWIPLALDRVRPPATAFSYPSIVRLKQGVTLADARRELTALLPRLADEYPSFVPGITTKAMMEQVKPIPGLTALGDEVTGGVAGTLWVLAGAAALVLLVACVNVANLTLVRFDGRQRELAVRAALGAGPGRVARYCLSEGAVVTGSAAVLALGAAWMVIHGLVAAGPPDIPRLSEIAIDWRTVSFLVVASLAVGAACSAIPAIRIGASRTVLTLRDASRGGTAGRAQRRTRSVLVAAQLALALVVLAASGLLMRSFQRLHSVRLGFDADHLATLWVSLPRTRYRDYADIVGFYERLVDRAAQVPGVSSVAVSSRVPLQSRGMNPNPIYPENDARFTSKMPPLESLVTIGGDYFGAMRIPLVAGKTFDPMASQREGDAIVSRRAAQLFWNDSTGVAALGKRFRVLPTGPWYTVTGVVGDTPDTSLAAGPSAMVYFPEIVQRDSVTRQTARTMAVVVRAVGEPSAVVPAIERIVRELDPTLPTFDVTPMRDGIRASTAQLAFTILILGGASVVTLLLAAVGLYGVMAYLVALRRRELGIRIALGASPRRIAAATTWQGLGLTTAGVGAGLVLFVPAVRFVRVLLFGVAPWDVAALGGAVGVLLAIATIATWLPARRAATIDPADSLRVE